MPMSVMWAQLGLFVWVWRYLVGRHRIYKRKPNPMRIHSEVANQPFLSAVFLAASEFAVEEPLHLYDLGHCSAPICKADSPSAMMARPWGCNIRLGGRPAGVKEKTCPSGLPTMGRRMRLTRGRKEPYGSLFLLPPWIPIPCAQISRREKKNTS